MRESGCGGGGRAVHVGQAREGRNTRKKGIVRMKDFQRAMGRKSVVKDDECVRKN